MGSRGAAKVDWMAGALYFIANIFVENLSYNKLNLVQNRGFMQILIMLGLRSPFLSSLIQPGLYVVCIDNLLISSTCILQSYFVLQLPIVDKQPFVFLEMLQA